MTHLLDNLTTSTEDGKLAKEAKIQSSTILTEILRNIFSKDNPVTALKFHHVNTMGKYLRIFWVSIQCYLFAVISLSFHLLRIMVAHCRSVPFTYHFYDFVQGLIWFFEEFLGF